MKNKIKQNNTDVKNFLTGMKNIIKTSIIVIVGLLVTSQVVFADSAILSALPLSASTTVGTSFNVLVQINPASNKVCIVKGIINLDNLSCQNITLAGGLMAQTVPTCAAPNFTIGIPKCVSASQNLFSVSVKGTQAGQASAFFTGVKVIGGTGGGSDVAFGTQSGNYNIVAVVQEPVVSTTTTPTSTEPVIIPEVTNPIENTGTGIEIPSGVGELNPIVDNGENVSTTTSSSSNVATTANLNNGFVATAFEGFSNIPNKLIVALILIAVIAMAGLIFYRRKDENTPKTPNLPGIKG